MQPVSRFEDPWGYYGLLVSERKRKKAEDPWYSDLIPYGDWDRLTAAGVGFRCAEYYSPMTGFKFFAHQNGDAYLKVTFSEDFPYGNKFKNYLISYGFVCEENPFNEEMYCMSKTYNELTLLFRIVSLHYDIPDVDLEKIRQVVERGCWGWKRSTINF
jgi:hypothetical protein